MSQRGVVINPTQSNINLENIIMAENQVSVVLRHGNEGIDNANFFKNWFIHAIARPSCPSCYNTTSHSYC